MDDRARDMGQIAQSTYDILVIGGGINGAAIACRAADKGLKTVLLEKNDFASGTSSKSTKLMHGGLRYLETLEFGFVKEALKERFIQLKKYPQFVKPLPFIIPVYNSSPRPLWLVRLGVFLYDVLSGRNIIEKHRSLSVDEVCQLVPGIKSNGLRGGVMYYDAQMDDTALCLANISSAVQAGAYAVHHMEVQCFIKKDGKAVGVEAYDVLGKKNFNVYSKKIICAVGPWANVFLEKETGRKPAGIRMTKGVHLVCKGQVSREAILFQTKKDKRIFFVIPWKGNTLVGTTDTDFTGNPDDVCAQDEDIAYLLKEVNHFFSGSMFSKENILETFAGLRPLVFQKGCPSKVSRKHVIEDSDSGVIYVMGGKFTTYRKIAEDTLEFIRKN
ncbi:Glycerol-3-phosphate dehydrogenase [hydrothermal vent metagenome]|uniref:Glycerol-3-phosphate dehydrogenase n=1 Tax=hydrothermal vent metagenome TaxID=652676 RepID=A0A3B1DCW3_9ZZZZ